MSAQRPMTPDELEAAGLPRNFHDVTPDLSPAESEVVARFGLDVPEH